ncbi:Armadillo-type fold [Phytophthora cactorum]|nr:Armadillo-type fold [Phytophthora cactorum]
MDDQGSDEEKPGRSDDGQESGDDEANDDGSYEIDLPGGGDTEEDASETPEQETDGIEDATKEESEHEMSPLEAEIARVLDEGCTQLQPKLAEHLLLQKNRLAECENRVQIALEQRQNLSKGKKEYWHKVIKSVTTCTGKLSHWKKNCDESETSEQRKESGLQDFGRTMCRSHATDALVTKRVERERVRRQLEEASLWKLMMPEASEDGESQLAYYTNTVTGESAWDAPVAVVFEAPPGWDMTTMDWEEDYGLENFYPNAQRQTKRPNSLSDDDNDDTDEENDAAPGESGKEEEEEEEGDDLPMDPLPARERFEEELKRYERLKAEVEQSAANQRSLAMEVLTATRELFEREEELLKEEDAAVIAVERKRRIAEKEEQAAAKAKAEAQQRKAQQASTGKASVPVFARDSVAKKGMTLAADDQVFEQELRDFAAKQRVDRLYLSMPLTRDPRVHDRHRLEPEYVHMKHIESRVLETEKTEFDLLEKSALRNEEAAAKATELRELCEQIRKQQKSVQEEIGTVEASIEGLEAAAVPPPEQSRPTEEELERAAGRYLTVDSLPDDEEKDDNEVDTSSKSEEFPKLRAARPETLDLEKAANTRMWDLQAQAQVVRARCIVERAAREESVFQMRDRLKELQQQLEDAYALPLQAIHPLERVELEAQSETLVALLKKQEMELQARYAKEEEAKALLVSLELRSCDYADAKLQEEAKLTAEKQSLWDLNFSLMDGLQSCRQTIERLYLLMQQEKDVEKKPMEETEEDEVITAENSLDDDEDAESSPRELYEENARVFEAKLQYLQQVRRFLLMCYDREDRWRALAASALIKDTTSDEWMTNMQLSRQEDSLALLQTQHEEQQQELQRQIKLLTKVKATLQAQIEELSGKIHRLQSDYQAASDSVRLQTQEVIKALRSETEEQKTEAHTDFINMQKEVAKQQQQHKQLQRGLRLANWRHRVTAQSILTDVNLLFSFFADGVEILAGASSEINDALRENAGIEVLAALARHSSQQSVRAICARALGQLSWNANATARSLGWKAKQKWFQWMKTQSNTVLDTLAAMKTPFDAAAEEEATEMNWLADPSAPIDDISSESDHDLSSKGGKDKAKKLLFTATWQQFDDKVFPDTNVANQQYMGLSSNVLQTILDLCRSPEADKRVKCNALHSLALIVRNSRIRRSLDEWTGVFRYSLVCWSPSPTIKILKLFDTRFRLLRTWRIGTPSTSRRGFDSINDQTLSHLSHDHVQSCQAIVESRGISILTQLCNSPRIHDAIDLDVYELIQTYASQVIANVITLLDQEESESDHRSYNVADFILQEQTQMPGYSRGVRKEREPDNQEQHKEEQATQQSCGVATFVLMCASCNRNVAFHGAVVLGSIAQHDAIRGAIGAASGMDALFLLAARTDDLPMVAQATWALANLTWNRDNQYRVARYIDHLYQLCTLSAGDTTQVSLNQQVEEDPVVRMERRQQDEHLMRQIREHGLCILANALFYNDANRQLVASHTDWMQLLARNALEADAATLENSARALCSLSYSDSIALQMGATSLIAIPSKTGAGKMNGLHIFIRLCSRTGQVAVQQHGLFGVINMCLHDVNKTRMLEIPHGVDTLVNLSGNTNKDLCDPALEALELLADMRQLKQDHGIPSTQSFESVDLKKLIALLVDASNASLVAMISDAIADEVWKRPSAQIRLRNEHGLEKLLEICAKPPPLFPVATSGSSPEIERRVRISCLWALRNTVANNVRNQDLVGALNGVQQLVGVFDRERRSEEVVEALLAALAAVVMKHPRNSQQLVQYGLDMLIGLADEDGDRLEEDRGVLPPINPSTRPTAAPSKLDPLKSIVNPLKSSLKTPHSLESFCTW